jgi:probable rRNA maturation factor
MSRVHITIEGDHALDEARFEGFAEAVMDFLDSKGNDVSLLFCGNDRIQSLNMKWRGKDKPTDVLSFPASAENDHSITWPGEAAFLGDIAISYETAAIQAEAFFHDLEFEFMVLFVHGVCHLLGFDHKTAYDATKMANMERSALVAAGVSNGDGLTLIERSEA